MTWIILTLTLLWVGCGTHRPTYTPDDPHWKDTDTQNIPEPTERDPSVIWATAERTTFEQLDQLVDLERVFRKIGGDPSQAWNINSFDEVPNSSWYTNRHHLVTMSTKSIERGASKGDGPDTTEVWTVFRPKVGGVTAGFWIKDARGDAYILKFDPPDNPELATAAAAISGRFLHACGYNVPQEFITSFRRDRLVIADGVTWEDDDHLTHQFDDTKLDEILTRTYQNSDGSYRCLASLALPNVKGPFSFDGHRKGDPNDWCAHEHRRELRALYVFCSLINHWDIKDNNTMDIFVEEDGRRFLRHFLLDFGSTIGSAGHSAQDPRSGYTNQFDLRDAFVSLVTLGLKQWQWEGAGTYEFPSVGYFESEIFHPAKWDPIYPIPAFENLTNRDAYWAAKVVMSFSNSDLRALVNAGRLSKPDAQDYLVETLVKRRNKIGRHWFTKVNPLDFFELEPASGTITITFRDLAVAYGFAKTSASRYDLRQAGKLLTKDEAIEGSSLLLSANLLLQIRERIAEHTNRPPIFTIEIKTRQDGSNNSHPVVLSIWYHADEDRYQLVGVEHRD